MKKILLAVLAIGAIAMVSCSKKSNDGGTVTPPQEPDYVVDAATFGKAQLEGYGDWFENGLNHFVLYWSKKVYKEDYGLASDVGVSIPYFVALDVTDGTGVISPNPGEPYAVNTYISEIASQYEGSVYYDYNYVYNEMYVSAFKSGNISISKDGDIYTIKGTIKTVDGKLVKIDYVGEVEYVYAGAGL
jgi:hypothetical protein